MEEVQGVTELIIIVVCVYAISVLVAFEAGRYDRRNQGTDIDGQWWMTDIQNKESEGFNFE